MKHSQATGVGATSSPGPEGALERNGYWNLAPPVVLGDGRSPSLHKSQPPGALDRVGKGGMWIWRAEEKIQFPVPVGRRTVSFLPVVGSLSCCFLKLHVSKRTQ